MRKSRLSLLVVATVIATILVAGCTSSTPTSPQVASTNTSTSSTTASATTTSAVKTASVSPSPSASASPTQAASPSPTASPTASGKIATSIFATKAYNSLGPNPTIARSGPEVSWGFEVVPTGSTTIHVPVTVKLDNTILQSVSGGTETVGVNFSPSSLAVGQHTITVSFAGDSSYKGAEQAFPFQISG